MWLVEGDLLRVEGGRTLRVGENVVARGAETVAGKVVLPVGRVLGAAEISVAASCGLAEVSVFARPTVAIMATGDELVELDEPMEAWQIRNSNSYALAAFVEAAGGVGLRLAIARDTLGELRAQVARVARRICCCCRVGFRWASMTSSSRCCGSFGRSSSLRVR